jgi:hypothetical protein
MQQQQQKQSSSSSSASLSYSHHATITYREVRDAGAPVRPLDFPPPKVRAGVRVNALVVHPQTGSRQVCSGVIHCEDLSSTFNHYKKQSTRIGKGSATTMTSPSSSSSTSTVNITSPTSSTTPPNTGIFTNKGKNSKQKGTATVSPESQATQVTATTMLSDTTTNNDGTNNVVEDEDHGACCGDDEDDTVFAYWPQRRLQDAIYGSVWACLVLRRHYGVAADDAARAANVEPGSPEAPIVWEITGSHVAIKMVEWSRVHHMRGRLLEDPVKEVAALQMLDKHPNVLHSTEVLQDSDFLYSVMPFCRDGDLFGIVVKYAEDSGGEIGMPEPVARYWFRQILNVRCFIL